MYTSVPPQSQVKGFPRRSKLLSTPGAPVVDKMNPGSLRAVVPQNGLGAGCWSEDTWELVFTQLIGSDNVCYK